MVQMRLTKYNDYLKLSYILLLGALYTLPVWGQRPERRDDETLRKEKAQEYYYQGVLAQLSSKTMEAYDLLRHAYSLDPTDPAIAFMLGGNYAQQGMSARALPLLEQAYATDSTNRTYARALSTAYIEADRMHDALRVNERLSEADPEDDDVRYRLVQLYARTGELRKGIQMATALQKRFRSIPEAYGQLTKLKIQLIALTKDKKAIAEEYRTWAELYPEDRRTYYDWILYLLQEGEVKEAEKQVLKAVRSGRLSESEACVLKVHRLIIQKDFAEAEAQLARLSPDKKIPVGEKLALWLRLNEESKGSEGYHMDHVLDHIRELVRLYPEDLPLLKSYTQALRYIERYQEAYDILLPQSKLHPSESWIWDELLNASIGLSSDSLTTKTAQDALPHLATDWRIYIILAGDLFRQDKVQSAIDILEQGVKSIDPKIGEGAARVYSLLADLYAERGGVGHDGRADSLYLQAIEANPQDAEALNNYAYRLAKSGQDLESAERYASQALKISPNEAYILDTYAYILLLKKNYTLAKLYQRRALSSTEPDKISPDMYDHMGDIYLGLGEYTEAIEAWTQALSAHKAKGSSPDTLREIEKKITEAKKAQKTK